MDTPIKSFSELLKRPPATAMIPPLSKVPALENFDDIPLTDEETAAALRDARERKFYRLQEENRAARSAELRRQLTERWSYEKTKDFMGWRIKQKSDSKKLVFVDTKTSNAGSVFELLCRYFSNDPLYVELALAAGIDGPDLRKGILLSGTVGTGKTSVMQLFSVNQRQVFMLRSAAETANLWLKSGEEAIAAFYQPHKLPVNDCDNFYQPFAGLCLDDCGTEDVKNHYGNRVNVIGQIIEGRYFNGSHGILLHMTTNLNSTQLKEFYGARVVSRLREIMNVIELKGEDRRK